MPRVNPPLPAVTGGIIRVTFWQQTDTNFQLFSQDFMGDHAPTTTLAADIANAAAVFTASIAPDWAAIINTTTAQYKMVFASRSDHTTPSLEYFFPPGTFGTVAGLPLPLTVAAVMTKRTAIRGQHGRGRLYYACVPVSFQAADENYLSAASQVLYGNFAAVLMAGFVGAGGGAATYKPCVCTKPAPAGVVTLAAPVTAFDVQPLLGNIRRRRIGRGI